MIKTALTVASLLMAGVAYSASQPACESIYGSAGDKRYLTGFVVNDQREFNGELASGAYLDGHGYTFVMNGHITFAGKLMNPTTTVELDAYDHQEGNLCRDSGSSRSDSLRFSWRDGSIEAYNLRLLDNPCYAGVIFGAPDDSKMQLVAFCVTKNSLQNPKAWFKQVLKNKDMKQLVCSQEKFLDEVHLTKKKCLSLFSSFSKKH